MYTTLLSLLAVLQSVSSFVSAAPAPTSTQSAAAPAFTYNATTFLLHGEPFQIMGGQMDPQRIPYQYWRDRLQRARAMGLNTIFSYAFWDDLEPRPGVSATDVPENDIASYFRIAQEEGLHIVLRPGPYVCGEHEWGGFPAWLSEVPDMVVRTNNAPFLNASKSYLDRLAEELKELQVSNGGPILAVQVENEYGSFGNDHTYVAAIRDILTSNFDVPLYTNDGSLKWMLRGGPIPGALAEVDGGPTTGFPARNKYVKNPTELGPLLDGEYYTWWPDSWCSPCTHQVADAADVKGIVSDVNFILGNSSASMSFYMVHGGTNWGFANGALWEDYTSAWTTTYDYGAPIDESGRTTNLYSTLRDTISQYVPKNSIPKPPANVPLMDLPEFELSPMASLFDVLGNGTLKQSPVPMEALGQAYGFILYEHTATASTNGLVRPGDRARDRVHVYVNGAVQGIIDSQYQYPQNVSVTLTPGDKLQLLVENLGRVNYFNRQSAYADGLRQPQKGILGNVVVGSTTLKGWEMYPIPLETLPTSQNTDLSATKTPVFHHATFNIPSSIRSNNPAAMDTYLAIPHGVKGQVFVNGVNLGRYWIVGPQQSLYLPGTILNKNKPNEVVVLELEPALVNGTMTAIGLAERQWFNNPDPDCVHCTQ